MIKIKKQDWYTVPNLLSFFRILLIPVFIVLYLRAEDSGGLLLAAAVVGLSALTDCLDGKIARRFHQITELGKFLDPLADKLTQGALVVCLTTRYPLMWLLAALYLIKEGFMGVMGLLMLRHNGRKLDGAKWFGKVCTALLFVVMLLLLLLPGLPAPASDALIVLCAAVMVWTLCCYLPVFYRMWRMDPR